MQNDGGKPANLDNIIVFDGVCIFCNWAVLFIIKRDPAGFFTFTPMQSELGSRLMQQHGIDSREASSMLLIKQQAPYVQSTAVLEICRELSGWWPLLRYGKFIPRPIRDWCYRRFANNRYYIFGRRQQCVIPDDHQALQDRLIT